MAIIVTENGKNAKKHERTTFKYEEQLQQYIFDNPESLPLYEIEEDIRLLIVSREFPTESGPIDALGIDENGEIYIIETKLYKNPDKRLVVAQVLDYGASLWKYYTDFSDFLNKIEILITHKFDISFAQKLQEYFEINNLSDIDIILDNLKNNLRKGKFRFVVLMDKLHKRLKDLIIFLNQNSQFDIFGVEMEYYKLENMEITIPKLFGAEVKKEVISTSGTVRRKKWDEISFFEDAGNKLSTEEFKSLKKLYAYSKDKADEIFWGTGITRGSFNPKFRNISHRSFYTAYSDGCIQINFGYMYDSPKTIEYRAKLKESLETMLSLKFSDEIENKFPNCSKDQILHRIDKFINIVNELIIGT